MALSKIQAESMNLADTYAFTGTVSGAGGGAYEVLSTTTSTNTSTAEVTGLDGGHEHHMIVAKIEPLTESTSNHVMCQLGNSNGYYSFGHAIITEIYVKEDNTDKSQNFTSVSDDASRLQMNANPLCRNADNVGKTNGLFYIFANNLNQAEIYKTVGGHGVYNHTKEYAMRSQFTGIYYNNTQFTKAKIFLSSGNSFKCTVTAYGSLEA